MSVQDAIESFILSCRACSIVGRRLVQARLCWVDPFLLQRLTHYPEHHPRGIALSGQHRGETARSDRRWLPPGCGQLPFHEPTRGGCFLTRVEPADRVTHIVVGDASSPQLCREHPAGQTAAVVA